MPCDSCGEIGRQQYVMLRGWDSLAYYCHDEEKSCYNYVQLKAAGLVG